MAQMSPPRHQGLSDSPGSVFKSPSDDTARLDISFNLGREKNREQIPEIDKKVGSSILNSPKDQVDSPQNQNSNPPPKTTYKEVQSGHRWGGIQYRDARYHGSILVTSIQADPATPTCSSDFEQPPPRTHQYRHGPGILILDTHTWIIATWDHDHLESGNKSAYIITADMGILELHIGDKNKTGTKEVIDQIEELSYLGTIYTAESFGDGKSRKKYGKFVIVGEKEERKVEIGSETWKWVADLSQEYHEPKVNKVKSVLLNEDKEKKHKIIYYMQTKQKVNQHYDNKFDVLYEKKVELTPNNSGGQIKDGNSRLSHYQYFIENIREILLLGSSQTFGFKIQQNRYTTVDTTRIINSPDKATSVHTANNTGIETIIYSNCHTNQSIYIKISAQPFYSSSYNSFVIEQLAILAKEPITLSSPLNSYLSIREGKTQGREHYYSRKYSYKVNSISLSHNVHHKMTTMLPQLQIEEKLEKSGKIQHHYRYVYSYSVLDSGKCAEVNKNGHLISQSHDYEVVRQEKRKQNLLGLNFVDKTHRKLSKSIKNIMGTICAVYWQIKKVQIADNNLSEKMAIPDTPQAVADINGLVHDWGAGRRRRKTQISKANTNNSENGHNYTQAIHNTSHSPMASEADLKKELHRILQQAPKSKSKSKLKSPEKLAHTLNQTRNQTRKRNYTTQIKQPMIEEETYSNREKYVGSVYSRSDRKNQGINRVVYNEEDYDNESDFTNNSPSRISSKAEGLGPSKHDIKSNRSQYSNQDNKTTVKDMNNMMDLSILTKQLEQLNVEIKKQSKKIHLPLPSHKRPELDPSFSAFTRSNTMTTHKPQPQTQSAYAPSNSSMSPTNAKFNTVYDQDEQLWSKQYKKPQQANRKRAHSIYEEYVDRYN